DVWVPAHSRLWSWSCLGGPSRLPDRSIVELKSLLYDRSGGQERLVRSPEGPPVHSDLVPFHRREPATTLMLDAELADGSQDILSAQDEARARDIRELVRVF